MSLVTYKKKRTFTKTPEPSGKIKGTKNEAENSLRFVVQKHQASHLHYDFRLELRGVLLSWAVPKGPSLNPADKRLAMMVEDHPYDYRTFEGTIPAGNYGAGTVMVWDEGTYTALGGENLSKEENERLVSQGLHKGHITFILRGKKLNGEFALVKIRGSRPGASGASPKSQEKSWLLIKADDDSAEKSDVTQQDTSAVSGKSMQEISENVAARKKNTERIEKTDKPKRMQKLPGSAEMPHEIKPMLATLVKEPFDDSNWIYEIKWDGYRTIAEIQEEAVQLYSRNNISFNSLFAPVRQELSKIRAHNFILDGEVVVLDAQGRSQFQLLQNFQNTGSGNLTYYVFDLLYLDGQDLREQPLHIRKELLSKLLAALPKSKLVRLSGHIELDGTSFFAAAVKQGLEGIIAKQKNSPYRTGKRSGEWLKVKTHLRQEAVIGGFTAPRGSRKDIGALVLGVYDKGKLVYIGHTGGGFNEASLKALRKQLQPLVQKESPFADKPKTNAPVQWVRPQLVSEVTFQEWTGDGHMRQPIFLGMRPDKRAQEVKRETPQSVENAAEYKNNPDQPPSMNMPKKKPGQNQQTLELPKKGATEVTINKHTLQLTHLDKVYWPKDKITKGDLIAYYHSVAEYMLPYLKDRPESLNRHPNGIAGKSFFQKDIDHQGPAWVKTAKIHSENENRDINYLLCQDQATLVYMANLGCIEINPWSSRIHKLDKPDFLVMDLDPEAISFEKVIEAALAVKKILDQAGAISFCKTSGATGLHIFVPLAAKYNYEQAKEFAHLVGILTNQQLPKTTSLERSPAKRQKKVYLDYLQNRRGQTLAAPYSVRPRPGAPVSTPLEWREVRNGLDPKKYTIANTLGRIKRYGDLWQGVLGPGIDLEKSLKKLS